MAELDQEKLERYSRQILLPDVGETGQKKLLAAKVLVTSVDAIAAVPISNLPAPPPASIKSTTALHAAFRVAVGRVRLI